MPRRILHHGPDPAAAATLLSERAVAGCWFEWHRLGGCGAGELRLRDEFADRAAVEPGDWISLETEPGVRWYLGRVESKEATFPAGIRLRLQGMGVELGEVFPGGFGSDVDGIPPQRFGMTDRFSFDPDRDLETFDGLVNAVDVVRLLIARYVVPQTHIVHVPSLIEDASRPAAVDSLKVRGEETVRAIIKELAVRAGAAAWGVNAAGEFFFLQQRPAAILTLRTGRDITALEEYSDRELLFNRVLLTGDYVYDRRDASEHIARRVYRWRGNFVQPESRAAHGERRLRMWIPWIRTQADSLAFVREFFRTYSQPARRYRVTTGGMELPTFPWLGRVRIEEASGGELFTGVADAIRVTFDRVPRLTLEIGPEDPRNLWPEPPHDERWELPDHRQSAGGDVSVTDWDDTSPGGGGSTTNWSNGTSINSGFTSESSAGSDASDDSDASDPSDASSGGGVMTSLGETSSELEESSAATSDDSPDESSDSSPGPSSDFSSGATSNTSLDSSFPSSEGSEPLSSGGDSSAEESGPVSSDAAESGSDTSSEPSEGMTSDAEPPTSEPDGSSDNGGSSASGEDSGSEDDSSPGPG
jgi:hypothetical protein